MAKVRIEDFNSVEPIVVNKSSKRTSGEVLTVSRDCKARLKGVPDEKRRVIIRGLSETTIVLLIYQLCSTTVIN